MTTLRFLFCFAVSCGLAQPLPLHAEQVSGVSPQVETFLRNPRAVMRVIVECRDGSLVSGTGFLVTLGGLLVTNCHVVENARSLSVCVNAANGAFATPVACRVVMKDEEADLALIQMEGERPQGMPEPLALSASAAGLLEGVVAIGFPASLDQIVKEIPEIGSRITDPAVLENFRPNITKGSVSKTGSPIVHDAKIGPGNSGGPLISAKTGEVLGVNTARTKADGFSITVPAADVVGLMERLNNRANDVLRAEYFANEGVEGAVLEYADMLLTGENGVEPDAEKAERLLRKAAENGSEGAAMRLGYAYKKGLFSNGKPDDAAAVEAFSRVDVAESHAQLYFIYSDKNSPCYSPEKAVAAARNGAILGDRGSQLMLAMELEKGLGCKRDLDKAVSTLEDLLQTPGEFDELTDAASALLLSFLVEQNTDAAYWRAFRVEKDYRTTDKVKIQAVDLFVQAVEKWYYGKDEDETAALSLAAEASDRGYGRASAEAAFWCLRRKHTNMAERYARLAVEQGDPDGYGVLAFLALDEDDYKAPLKYLKQGLEKASGLCCAVAGSFYSNGTIVKKDVAKAREFFEEACVSDSLSGRKLASALLRKLNDNKPAASSKKSSGKKKK